jgi:DNA polymerase-3 subunit gamma/tau
MTLYLKYRPQKISELDLAGAREALEPMVLSGNVPHALLFSGPRGIGKTSAARIVAKAINCVADGEKPCNKCEMCKAITGGAATDVVEIDAASNRGIDEIRELREKVRLAPMQAKFKVFIIDEVHMLTNEAANALLKTLEEPPAHAVFILCTTDPEKLPETVLSRCTRVQFRKPTVEEMVGKLKKVAEGEKVVVDESGLKLISAAARGSFRDAIKIFEQVWVVKGKVGEADVREVLGALSLADPEKFVEDIKRGETAEALKLVNDLAERGVNMRGFVEQLVEYLRTVLLSDLTQKGWIIPMI